MTDDPRDILQNLIETCRDGETGYLHAATVADNSELKSYFQQQSLERARFRAELTDAIKRLGEPDPDTSGSTAAVLHRAWFEAKNDFGGGDHTLLESVEQGEDSAKQSYERALGAHPRLSCCELSLVTPPTLAEDVREVDHEKAPFRSRGRQMFALLNSEATKRDVDKWTEDLLNRIQLCIMHPHSVIHQNNTPSEGALELCEMGLGERRSL